MEYFSIISKNLFKIEESSVELFKNETFTYLQWNFTETITKFSEMNGFSTENEDWEL